MAHHFLPALESAAKRAWIRPEQSFPCQRVFENIANNQRLTNVLESVLARFVDGVKWVVDQVIGHYCRSRWQLLFRPGSLLFVLHQFLTELMLNLIKFAAVVNFCSFLLVCIKRRFWVPFLTARIKRLVLVINPLERV